MKIYDRYAGSAGEARREQKQFYIQRWLGLVGGILLWLLLLWAACFWIPTAGVRFFLFWVLVALAIMLFDECISPLRQNDLYTFGFDGKDFAVLGVSGKVKRLVKCGELEMIHILPAQGPATRIRYRRRSGGKHALFFRFGERKRVNGKKRFVHEPMALLLTKEQPYDKKLDWTDRVHPSPEHLLYNNIGFVISGGNTKIFLKLLKNSACPVMTNRKFYELHKEMLEKLFAQAGMDMNRLQIDGE